MQTGEETMALGQSQTVETQAIYTRAQCQNLRPFPEHHILHYYLPINLFQAISELKTFFFCLTFGQTGTEVLSESI
jgi:hypothetical protein